MTTYYFFMFGTLIFSVILGMFTEKGRWVAGTICAVTFVYMLIGHYAMNPADKLSESLSVISPFLVGGALICFVIGFAGATLGQYFKQGNSAVQQKAAFLRLGKRAGVIAKVVIVWVLVSFIVNWYFMKK